MKGEPQRSAEGSGVRLVEMKEDRFREYRERLAEGYARERVRAGVWSEDEALGRARRDVDELLPDGLGTRDHFLYEVVDPSEPEPVGLVWLALRDSVLGPYLWIYDIAVYERFRRMGYGSRTLRAVEERARELGANRVELHVFGHNRAARTLYEKAGYGTTSIVMSKPLSTR
jgi:RimJ/RimL family protein N-acetyltransferase